MGKTRRELEAENKVNQGCLEVIGTMILIPFALLYGVLAWGFVVQIMWNWYVAPLGLPVISLLWAYGLAITATLVTKSHSVTKNENDKVDGGKTFGAILAPWLVLLAGWLTMYAMENYFPEQLPKNMIVGVDNAPEQSTME